MSSGKQHSDQAEKLLEYAELETADAAIRMLPGDRDPALLDAAQVHATLALAKAVNSLRWWLDKLIDLNEPKPTERGECTCPHVVNGDMACRMGTAERCPEHGREGASDG